MLISRKTRTAGTATLVKKTRAAGIVTLAKKAARWASATVILPIAVAIGTLWRFDSTVAPTFDRVSGYSFDQN